MSIDKKSIVSTRKLSITAIFTALVCVATMVIQTYVPATQGFFNIGESMIYLAAILFGPFVGAFAGGVGAMIADLLTGYAIYAPATLVVKACEGAAVGYLVNKKPAFISSKSWKYITVILGISVGLYIWWVGTNYYSGEMLLTSSLGQNIVLGEIELNIPPIVWAVIGLGVAVLLSFIGYRLEPDFGWTIFSVLIGGFIMTIGYYLYQQYFMGVAAIIEVPINLGQMTIGAAIALPLSKMVKKSLPDLLK